MSINKRDVIMEINDRDVSFSVDLAAHNAYVNGMNTVNKVQPSHNFIASCVAEPDKSFVMGIIKGQGGGFIAVQLAAELAAEYTPEVSIKVKKPSNTPMESEKTD